MTFDGTPLPSGSPPRSPTLALKRGGIYVFQVTTGSHVVALHTAPGQTSTLYRYTPTSPSGSITNNGISSGSITLVVPVDAPAVLYYQSESAFALFGRELSVACCACVASWTHTRTQVST